MTGLVAGQPGPGGRTNAPPARATGVIIVGMSLAVWWPAFTLGAWGVLFFEQLLTVWVAATAALVVVLIQPKGQKNRIWRLLALLVPSIWLVLALIIDPRDHGSWGVVLDVLGGFVSLLGLPATIWVLARIIWPEFGAGIPMIRRVIVLLAVATIGILSYELGVHNALFLTCSDFTISGNSEPAGCISDAPGLTPKLTPDDSGN